MLKNMVRYIKRGLEGNVRSKLIGLENHENGHGKLDTKEA